MNLRLAEASHVPIIQRSSGSSNSSSSSSDEIVSRIKCGWEAHQAPELVCHQQQQGGISSPRFQGRAETEAYSFEVHPAAGDSSVPRSGPARP
eukprot:scaffold155068_cov21-Tisochrysis_lutea.AAC.1